MMISFARVFLISFVFCVSVLDLGSTEISPCWSPLGSDRCKGVLRTKTLGRRVMAGRPSARGEIPWQVALYRSVAHVTDGKFELFCGGSIITHQSIITAAHCFQDIEQYSFKAIIGDLDKTVMEIDEQEFQFTRNEVYSHPNYDVNTDENDIAIIKLKSIIQFNKYADAITLPIQGLPFEGHLYCTISGWGKTEEEDHPNILHVATVITFGDELCKSEHFYGTKIKDMMFCAGSQLGGSDSCQGDSGGPLVCEVIDSKDYVFSVQYGIVSYGIGCGVADKPGVYTKLSEFHDWINETLNSPDRPEDKNLKLRISNNVDILGGQEKQNICSLPRPTELCVKGKGPPDEFCKKIARAAGNSNKPMCFHNGTCTFHVNQPTSGDAYVSLSKINSDNIIHSCSNNDLHVVDPIFTSDLTESRKDTTVDGPNWAPLGMNRCGLIDDSVRKVEFKSSAKKVVGGEITERGQLPWQVGLYRKLIDEDEDFKLFCGGSIITKQHILTAAHCFQDFEKFSYKVTVGDFDRTVTEPEEQEFTFDANEIYSHENYSKSSNENDLAIIKLKGTIQLNKYAQPICLPANTLKYEDKLNCVVSGWGKTRDVESVDNSIKLRAAHVQTLPYEDCRHKDSYGSRIKETMFCAGSFKGGADSCQGDSGGPIVCDVQDPNKHTLIQYGVVSFGWGCGNANKPGVYTRLSEYQNWIDQTLKESIKNIAVLVSKKIAVTSENIEPTTSNIVMELSTATPGNITKELTTSNIAMESTTSNIANETTPGNLAKKTTNSNVVKETTTSNKAQETTTSNILMELTTGSMAKESII